MEGSRTPQQIERVGIDCTRRPVKQSFSLIGSTHKRTWNSSELARSLLRRLDAARRGASGYIDFLFPIEGIMEHPEIHQFNSRTLDALLYLGMMLTG